MYTHAIRVIPQTMPSKRRGMMSECPGGNCGNPSPATPPQQPSFELRPKHTTLSDVVAKFKSILGIESANHQTEAI